MAGGSNPIYLDYNATTPIDPRVLDAMMPYLRETFGNPSSGHSYGRQARQGVETAREQVAALLGCAPDEIYFTSGGTEANNIAIRGAASACAGRRRHVVTSVVEHPATEKPCRWLEQNGYGVTRVPVGRDCRVEPGLLKAVLREDTAIVTIMLAQNETGTLMPIQRVSPIAHARGAIVHTDAAQAVGKIRVDVGELGVDLLSIAGHKLYAPKGVGALYVRRGTPIEPVLLGAGHERGLRPGTENVASIAGLGEACAIAARDIDQEAARQRSLRDGLWEQLCAGIPGISLNGHPTERLPNTLNCSFPGVRGSAVLALADGVAASTGSACHAGDETPSGVLTAMGISPQEALGAIRLSLGHGTTADDITEAARMLVAAWRESCA